MNIVERITLLCEKEGTTKGTIEKELTLGHGRIQKWENHDPSAPALFKVAKRFNVTMEYLLTGEEQLKKEQNKRIMEYARRICALSANRQQTVIDAIELQEYQQNKEIHKKETNSNA